MIYEYSCVMCGDLYEIVKPVRLMDREEICPKCLLPLQREISLPNLNYKHNYTVAEKNERTKWRLDRGTNPVCIGNEKPNLKPVLKTYPEVEQVLRRHNGY